MKNQKQAPINPAEVVEYLCPKCGGVPFDIRVKLFRLPKLAMSNSSGKDIPMQTPIYQCSNSVCKHILEEVTPG